MHKLLLVLALVGVATLASAQETYSVPASAPNVADFAAIIAAKNEKTCERLGLADTCTQAQACTAAGAVGGASCTAAQARAANARIYPATQAGREEYVLRAILEPWLNDQRATVLGRTWLKACRWWNNPSTTQTQKNTECTNKGLTAPCTLYPPTCSTN